MKTKILKKIKKRFSYYRNDKGEFILIDGKKKQVSVIDFNFYKELYDDDVENEEILMSKIQVSLEEYYFRLMKSTMYKTTVGDTWAVLIYPRARYGYAMKQIRNGKTL